MIIKVLGPGCVNCRTLEHRTREALESLHLDALVRKVTDLEGIMAYGVLRTPGLVIDDKLVAQGYVPTVEKIRELIATEHKETSAP